MIITVTIIEVFDARKAASVKPQKAVLDAMDVMKLTGRIFREYY